MMIRVDRSSVAMGDDIDPHEETMDVPAELPLADVVASLLERRYLASIAGGKATWTLETDRPLAVVAEQWNEPRFLVDPSQPISSFAVAERGVFLMFRYWMQRDPEFVFTELSAGRDPRR